MAALSSSATREPPPLTSVRLCFREEAGASKRLELPWSFSLFKLIGLIYTEFIRLASPCFFALSRGDSDLNILVLSGLIELGTIPRSRSKSTSPLVIVIDTSYGMIVETSLASRVNLFFSSSGNSSEPPLLKLIRFVGDKFYCWGTMFLLAFLSILFCWSLFMLLLASFSSLRVPIKFSMGFAVFYFTGLRGGKEWDLSGFYICLSIVSLASVKLSCPFKAYY